jgi:hypothetical protein
LSTNIKNKEEDDNTQDETDHEDFQLENPMFRNDSSDEKESENIDIPSLNDEKMIAECSEYQE